MARQPQPCPDCGKPMSRFIRRCYVCKPPAKRVRVSTAEARPTLTGTILKIRQKERHIIIEADQPILMSLVKGNRIARRLGMGPLETLGASVELEGKRG